MASPTRRRLKPLVISMGGHRQAAIEEMFAHPRMAEHFEPPAFSPGVPIRSIRNAKNLLTVANQAGLLPEHEWDALSTRGLELYEENPLYFLDCLTGGEPGSSSRPCADPIVPVLPGRHGSERDRKLHYSIELWWKAKSIARQRSVLACFLAHLIAMKRLTTSIDENYDFILEDNVRVPVGRPGNHSIDDDLDNDLIDTYCECAERIWATLDASNQLSVSAATDDEADTVKNKECHLRYYGWLGSKANLKWLYTKHIQRMREREDYDDGNGVLFPYPTVEEFRQDSPVPRKSSTSDPVLSSSKQESQNNCENSGDKGSGTPIWGCYAYWISRPGYEALLADLRNDVGAILWRGKNMPAYIVKPIDKVVPRRIAQHFGRDSIHITSLPAFFRAPMLRSTIHSEFDVEFCKSSEYQMQFDGMGEITRARDDGEGGDNSDGTNLEIGTGIAKKCRPLNWSDLWLTDEEKNGVERRELLGGWLNEKES